MEGQGSSLKPSQRRRFDFHSQFVSPCPCDSLVHETIIVAALACLSVHASVIASDLEEKKLATIGQKARRALPFQDRQRSLARGKCADYVNG